MRRRDGKVCLLALLLVTLMQCGFRFDVIASEPFAIPDLKAQNAARGRLRPELSQTRSTQIPVVQATNLAHQMLGMSREKTDTAEKWVLAESAVALLASSGNVQAALTTLDSLSLEFQVELLERKTDAIASAVRRGDNYQLQVVIHEMLESCLASDTYDCYQRNIKLGFTVAGRARNKAFLKYLKDAQELGEESEARFKQVVPIRRMLRENANDPKLNRAVGEFYCYWKNQWDSGLKYLAKARGSAVGAIAVQELKASGDASDLAAVGFSWIKTANQHVNAREAANIYMHAAIIFERLLAKLVLDAANQEKIEQQLSRLATTLGNRPDGDVALHSLGAQVYNANKDPHYAIDGRWNGIDYTGFAIRNPAVIELGNAYSLGRIEFRFMDTDDRFYRYLVHTSIDGNQYRLLKDRSDGQWRSWQRISFEPRLVKFIRITGLHDSSVSGMDIIEVIAR